MEFRLTSYDSHQRARHDASLVETWRNEKTVDAWRHRRMYRQLDPLLKVYPGTRWLTIGDGRYGTDAHYISSFTDKVVASDINDTYLKDAKAAGFIRHYAVENAEQLSFQDGEFDFVLCKEAYHHFPRPMLAIYEMLRVASKGIILIEPNDQAFVEPYQQGFRSMAYWSLFAIKQRLKNLLGKRPALFPNRYESSGNYVFTISRRELEKVGLGLNLPMLATKGMNDSYIEGVESELVDSNGPLYRKIQTEIERMDTLSQRRPETYGLLVAMLFKEPPLESCVGQLQANGFTVTTLEKNPYANA